MEEKNSFESKMKRLNEISNILENNNEIELEEMIKLTKEAKEIAKNLEEILKKAKDDLNS